MVRPSRLLAVTRYELRTHMGGRPALRLLGVAVTLMLPISTLSFPRLGGPSATTAQEAAAPPKIAVRGHIPAALSDKFVQAENSPYELRGEHPVTVVGTSVGGDVRAALDGLEGQRLLEIRNFPLIPRLPGRSLLIAILAVSLLTGPLAEALPGERARRTLEVLLTAGISRGELIGGKWLAWTGTAVLTAACASGVAYWRGLQPLGWWLAGIPLFIASAVAIGLWLVRLVDDVVGGSAAPMRVLPVAATAMAVVAGLVAKANPVAAAAVPLGGPLLVAADLFRSPAQALSATVGTVFFVTALLWRTGSELDRVDTFSTPTRWGALGLCGIATTLWWLTVGGSAVWFGGGPAASELVTPLPRAMTVGSLALLACALIAVARDSRRRAVPVLSMSPSGVKIVAPFLITLALALSGPLPELDLPAGFPTLHIMLARIREGAVPSTMMGSLAATVAALTSVFGQSVLFRAVVAPRVGWVLASGLWAVAVCPLSPWSALLASGALGAMAERFGWRWALGAHLTWAAAASLGVGAGNGPTSLGFQTIALMLALGARWIPVTPPTRHQL